MATTRRSVKGDTMTAAAAGTRLGGRYELTERIAGGGMGDVWRASDRVLGRQVAVKVVKAGLVDDESFRMRFRNEARLAARLAHGNIAQVYDFGEDGATAYLVMELVDGTSVADVLRRGPLPPGEASRVLAEAAAGLEAAHELGMVHRDVKPANLLLTRKGTVKVTDFGIARALGEAKVTQTGEVVGTVQYLAPEAARGAQADAQADVYALAVVAYELLAGRRPFLAESAVSLALQHINDPPPPLPPNVPAPVATAVLRGLAKDPAQRPRGTVAFASEVRRAAQGSAAWTMPPPASRPEPAAPLAGPPAGPEAYGPPPISAPQNVSSTPPAILAQSPPARPVRPAPSRVARGLAWAWVAAATLTALACLLPVVTLGPESWSMLSIARPAELKGEPYESSNNVLGWLILIPMLLVAALGLPSALRRPHWGWALGAIPGCLWSSVLYLAVWGTAASSSDEPSPVHAASGAWLVPLLGTVTLGLVIAAGIAAIVTRRR